MNKTKTDKGFTLRMDQDLFNRISEIAKKERRSVASQIEIAVEQFVLTYNRREDETNSLPFWYKIIFINVDLLNPCLLDILSSLSKRLFSIDIFIRFIIYQFPFFSPFQFLSVWT